ncbi:predicted protein [Sparassis crispa]|uniref:Uncharacterized protein n=1 Tax=Sparassis crispa TaxID=139825 RepID=A0A401GP90_9APHY|nr:predicted protein [Sparassis crispa]GBE84045.1 predicted protein [Sparassis crispa]
MSASLKFWRLVSLCLANAFGIIGMSLGIDALVKSNRQKTKVRHSVPAGTSVSLNTNDVVHSGIVNTVICGLIAGVSFVALVTTIVSASPHRAPLRRVSLVSSAILLFLSTWLFATLIPFTDFVANRQAKVKATLDGISVPQSVIQATQAKIGVTGIYHKLLYLRLQTIFRWMVFLFGVLSVVFLYAAEQSAESARYPPVAGDAAGSIREVDDKPKEKEKVGVQQV